MPVPVELLRVVLGVLCVFFAHMMGRAGARVWRGEPARRMFGWTVRTAVTALGVAWRHGLDAVMIAVLAGAALSAAAGAWLMLRPQKPEEDLSREIVPRE